MASMTVAKTSKVSAVCAAAAAVAQSFQRRVSSTWLFLALFSVSGRLVHIPIPSNGTAQYIARASGPSIAIGSRRVYASARSRTRGISVKLSRLPEESLQVFELNLLVPGHYLLEVLKLYDSFDPLDERLADKCLSVHTEFVGNVTVPRPPLEYSMCKPIPGLRAQHVWNCRQELNLPVLIIIARDIATLTL